jgi:hypothetical protein
MNLNTVKVWTDLFGNSINNSIEDRDKCNPLSDKL